MSGYEEPEMWEYDGPHEVAMGSLIQRGMEAICVCGWNPNNHPGFILADHIRDMTQARFDTMISDEVAEASARVNYEARTGKEWALLNNFARPMEIAWMRLALEAAAPFMLAEAWQDGATDGHLYGINANNPYRRRPNAHL